jgi:hypothetical protein
VLPQQDLLLKQLHGKIEVLAAVDPCPYLKKLLVQHLTGMIHQPLQQFLNLVEVQTQMLSNEQFAELANQGGVSRSFRTGEAPKGPGVMVSIPGAEKITNAPYTAEQAKSFKEEHAAKAKEDDYQGAWNVKGKIFADISKKAQEFADQAQISRGDTYKGKKISVNEVYATIAKNRRNRGV